MMRHTGGIIESEYVAAGNAIKQEANVATEDEDDDEYSIKENILTDPTQEIPSKEINEIEVKTVDVSQYNTINLQKELAESMKEFLESDFVQEETPTEEEMSAYAAGMADIAGGAVVTEEVPDAEGEQETIKQEGMTQLYVSLDTDEMQPVAGDEPISQEVFFGNTAEVNIEEVVSELVEKNAEDMKAGGMREADRSGSVLSVPVANPDPAVSNTGVIKTFTKPSGYDNILSQEYDGQISLVVPEEEKIEKQITGQLSIDDIMSEWERVKKENEQKRMQEIKERVQKQTNTLFADFDESTKTGLLEELEKAMISAAMKEEKRRVEEGRPRVIKVADIEKEEAALTEKPIAEKGASVEKEPAIAEESVAVEEPVAVEELVAVEEPVAAEEPMAVEESVAAEEAEEISEEVLSPEDEVEELQEIEEPSAEISDEAAGEKEEEAALEETQKPEEKAEVSGRQTREMTQSEREQFAPFIHHKKTRRQIVEAIDNVSMASYTGNVIVTGEEGTGTTALAKLLVKEVQLSDNNFSGKVAKISASTMNKKDVAATLDKLEDGALIIEEASSMKKATVESLVKELNQENKGIIVLLTDSKQKTDEFLQKHQELLSLFNLRVDVEALDDQTLVKYAKKYALEQEYAIDELGVLALHTRIAEMQTSDHEVTLAEIEELIDEAIYFADKKTPTHFFDVLLGKRYDEEDMIILREKDFMHY